MKIEYNYLQHEFADSTAVFRDWEKLIRSSEFTLGPFVKDFEERFAAYIGGKHCISTNNGTDALILSLKALGIGAGDEIITVTNTFYATVGAIVAVGATPVLIDTDDRFQINLKLIEQNITSKTKAVLPVHWGGASPNMEKISEICEKYNLFIIEDACMGIGASIHNKSAGTFGHVNAFSMHPLKSLNVMGDGGMVITDDDNLASWMRKFRNHGMIDRDHIEFWGVNMRLQPIQAIVASHALDRLENSLSMRRKNASLLDEGLSYLSKKGFVQVPERLSGYEETYALYMALFKNRDNLKKYLEHNDIEVKIHYPIPIHKQKAAQRGCKFNQNELINSEIQSEKLLTIPVHQFVTTENIEYMLEKISLFYS